MKTMKILVARHTKLFFKDKAMFLTSLITPMILLILYATFLGNVYESSFRLSLQGPLPEVEEILDGLVGGQLISSILAVSAVTVSFCSNMLMVQDKANGSIRDFNVSPVHPFTLSLSYFIASMFSTLLICFTASALCFVYVACIGWYMSFLDVILILGDVILLVLFGTALSGCIGHFLSTQGQVSAVGSMVSSCYGFLCGAYMPISQFSEGLRNAISFLPGTHGTSLLRRHALRGVLSYMEEKNYPSKALEEMCNAVDCNLYLFDFHISDLTKFVFLAITVIVLLGLYLFISYRKGKKIHG